jgi:hypothetical protein
MPTNSSNIVEILATFYINFRDDDNLSEFFEFNDLGLPAAFLASEGLVEITPEGNKYIEETWNLFLVMFQVEDIGFSSLDEILDLKREK